MSRPRLFSAHVSAVGAASLATLSLLVTSLTPFVPRANAVEEESSVSDIASSQEAVAARSREEAAAVPAAEASGAEASGAEGTEGSTITNTATLGEFDQIDSNTDNNADSATFTVGGTLSGTIYNDGLSIRTPKITAPISLLRV